MNTRSNYNNNAHRGMNEIPLLQFSGSSSSSGSPSSNDAPSGIISSRRPWNNKHHLQEQQQQPHASADSSILRGAEILRRQLIDDDEYDHDKSLCTTGKPEQKTELDNDPQSSSHDWSYRYPWRPPKGCHGRPRGCYGGRAAAAEETEEPTTSFCFPAQGDAAHDDGSEDDDDDEDTVAILERASKLPAPVPPRVVSPDTTPDLFIGRNGSLRTKVETILVQRHDEMDGSTYDSSYDDYGPSRQYLPNGMRLQPPSSSGERTRGGREPPRESSRTALQWNRNDHPPHANPLDLLKDLQSEEEEMFHDHHPQREEEDAVASLLKMARRNPNVSRRALPSASASGLEEEEPSPCQNIVSPKTRHYSQLLRDPGFQHAQRAGTLWQSLVSQHVRFPSKWWNNGARSPPMGVGGERRPWNYLGRHRVRSNAYLKGRIPNRGSAGRLLLHLVVRDIMTLAPVLDISIGCFDPNARGVRKTVSLDPALEDCRDIWLAIRRRGDDISVIESLLKHNGRLQQQQQQDDEEDDANNGSPLGAKHAVHNGNMRAVFGETAPAQTVFALESELYELFSRHLDGRMPPAAVLLQHYLLEF